MSETPVPEARREVASDEGSARRGSGRPVSAFASSLPPLAAPLASNVNGSEGPLPSRGSGLNPVPPPDPTPAKGSPANGALASGEQALYDPLDEQGFIAGLQAAGVLRELSLSEIERISESLAELRAAPRRLDLLEAYYGASGDAVAALRRRAADRWFVYRSSDQLGAPQLMQRLLGVVPELSGAHLERVGSASGTLVIRLGDHICALDDEAEDRGIARVSVHEVVRALNVLLERKGVRSRLVGLLGDGAREAYLGLPSLTAALALTEADYLTAPDIETLMTLTAW
jgi:hypothetical protein